MSNYAPIVTTGNGVTANFALPWPYLLQAHVFATVSGVPAAFTWLDSGTIHFTAAPAVDAPIHIYRVTSDYPAVEFTTGQIESSKLTFASRQALFRAAESVLNTQLLMGGLLEQTQEAAEDAEDAANAAALAAANAENSDESAAEHEMAAAAHEAGAIVQVIAATDQAAAASGSAAAAAASASTADSHRVSAGAQATNSSSSAQAAAADRVAVEGIRVALLNADLGGYYMPPSATNPTTRVGGGALVGGELYYNTAVPEWRRYNGTAFTQAFGSGVPAVAKSGDTMTGLLTLSADPVSALHAATKQYTDAKVSRSGDTMTGKLTLMNSGSGAAGLNIGVGTDPSSPINGDVWATASDLNVRVNGATRNPALRQSANTYTSGAKQTFRHGGTDAGIRVGTAPSDPSTVLDGDLWYNGDTHKLRVSVNTVIKDFSFEGHTHVAADVTDLAALLAGKANTSHSHAIADVTGLTTALAGKADTSHTHTFASLTSKPTTISGYGITDVGTNGFGTRTVSTAAPSGGVDGDVWYQV